MLWGFSLIWAFSLVQEPWDKVKEEMTNEKGLDPAVADKIGVFVKRSGMEGGRSDTSRQPRMSLMAGGSMEILCTS